MIGWGKAFWKGLIIFSWAILWAIIGALIFIFLSVSILAGVVSMIGNTGNLNSTQIITQVQPIIQKYAGPILLIFIFVGVFVGVATFASVVKVISDTVIEEVKKSQMIQTVPIPPPPPMAQIQQPPKGQSDKGEPK
jgi:hypothetical protein